MRTALVFVLPLPLLLACSAEAPTGPAPTNEAGVDALAAGDASCDFTRQRLIPGRGCVSSTPENCDGMACARGLICNTETGPDGGQLFLCIMDPEG